MTIYKIHFTNLIFFAIIQNLTKDYPKNSQKTREIIQNVITKLLVRSHSLSLNPTKEAFSVKFYYWHIKKKEFLHMLSQISKEYIYNLKYITACFFYRKEM